MALIILWLLGLPLSLIIILWLLGVSRVKLPEVKFASGIVLAAATRNTIIATRRATMLNQQEIVGRWNEIKGVLKKKWSALTDDDVMSFNGNVDQLIGKIQHKTGESREAIEHFIDQAVEHGQGMLGGMRDRASDAVHDGAKYVSDSVQGGAKYVADKARYGGDRVRQGVASAGQMVQDIPGQSIAAAIGLGLIVGVGMTMLMHERRQESMASRGRTMMGGYLNQLTDKLSSLVSDLKSHVK